MPDMATTRLPSLRVPRWRRHATTLVETLVVLAVVVVVGSLIVGIGSAVWKLLKSWQ